MRFADKPDVSRKAALAVQSMPFEMRLDFNAALDRAEKESDLSVIVRDLLENGYKPKSASL